MKKLANTNQQLQQFFQNNSLGFAVFDATYCLLRVNPPFCEITAYPEQELNDLTILDIVHPDDADKITQLVQQLFNGETSSFTIQQRLPRKNGEMLWVNLTISAIRSEAEFAYGIAMVEDISSYKQVEEAYQHLRERMKEIEQLATIGRLTSTLTHEINNSMHVVQGLLNLSLEELDNPVDLMSYLNMSLAESAKVAELISRLRHSYRVEPEPVAVVELNQLLEEVAVLAHRELKRKEISVHTRFGSPSPSITSRFNQLYLIFLSLLLNLGETMGAIGRGEIEIQSKVLSENVEVTLLGNNDEFQVDVTELNLSLSFSGDKIVELGGNLSVDRQHGGITCVVQIPFSIPETPPTV